MVDEAIVKGMGVVWTESFQSYEGAPTMIGSQKCRIAPSVCFVRLSHAENGSSSDCG